MRILYTSDIHAGNKHLLSMTNAAVTYSVDAVIIGGDIVPHYLPQIETSDALKAQRIYLEKTFVPELYRLKQCLSAEIFLDFSNDDFFCNRDILERQEGKLIHLLHMKKHPLTEHIDIIGYMNVPITPFQRKDWEKPDSKEMPYAPDSIISLQGYITKNHRREKIQIDPSSEDTIENDLKVLSNQIDRPFVFVAHSPPYNTPLDVIENATHVGSRSIFEFIESKARKNQIVCSLHGHIHSSPLRSGRISTRIRNILCINPGQNEGTHADLRYIIIELDERSAFPQIQLLHAQ